MCMYSSHDTLYTHQTNEIKKFIITVPLFHHAYLYTGSSTAPPTTDVSHLSERTQQFLRAVQLYLAEMDSTINHLTCDLQTERENMLKLKKECSKYRDIITSTTTAMSVSSKN